MRKVEIHGRKILNYQDSYFLWDQEELTRIPIKPYGVMVRTFQEWDYRGGGVGFILKRSGRNLIPKQAAPIFSDGILELSEIVDEDEGVLTAVTNNTTHICKLDGLWLILNWQWALLVQRRE